MKRTLLTCVGVLALASSALAADLEPAPVYKAPPPPAPSWTGCYISGGGGGGVFTTNQHFETFPGLVSLPAQDNGGQGWMGLAGGGCDYQFPLLNWNVVVGAFGDYDFMNFRGTIGANSVTGPVTGDMEQNAAWAGGVRLGLLAAPNALVYTNGGYTGTHLNSVNFTDASTLPAQNLNGWFVGGGFETSLSWIFSGLYWRTEYRYSRYETTNTQLVSTATGAPIAVGFNTNLAEQSVFTELVWRFNFTAFH